MYDLDDTNITLVSISRQSHNVNVHHENHFIQITMFSLSILTPHLSSYIYLENKSLNKHTNCLLIIDCALDFS